jgi:hypothetical protein
VRHALHGVRLRFAVLDRWIPAGAAPSCGKDSPITERDARRIEPTVDRTVLTVDRLWIQLRGPGSDPRVHLGVEQVQVRVEDEGPTPVGISVGAAGVPERSDDHKPPFCVERVVGAEDVVAQRVSALRRSCNRSRSSSRARSVPSPGCPRPRHRRRAQHGPSDRRDRRTCLESPSAGSTCRSTVRPPSPGHRSQVPEPRRLPSRSSPVSGLLSALCSLLWQT